MKKIPKKYLLFGFAFLTLAIIHYTQALAFFMTESNNLEPAYEEGDFVVGTSWFQEINRKDVVGFKRSARPEFGLQISRVMGVGGDKIALKDGFAYVNGELVDDSSQIKFAYFIPEDDFVKQEKQLTPYLMKYGSRMPGGYYVGMRPTEASRLAQELELVKMEGSFDAYSTARIGTTNMKRDTAWTVDNFGPIQVPAAHVFLLGDFRDNSEDSRYIGFIPEKDIRLKFW